MSIYKDLKDIMTMLEDVRDLKEDVGLIQKKIEDLRVEVAKLQVGEELTVIKARDAAEKAAEEATKRIIKLGAVNDERTGSSDPPFIAK